MSRPRSRSPNYRRFPWEEPDFDPRKVITDMDVNPLDRGHHLRDDPEGLREPYREERYPEGQRRSPFRDKPHFRHQDEFPHWRASPHHDKAHFENRRFSPRDEGGFDAGRHRGEFRDDFQGFDDRGKGPPVLSEGPASAPRPHADHRWRMEEQGRDQGRFRDFSPGMRSGDTERGGRFPQHPNRGREQHYDRGPPFKRPRRETDAGDHPGFRDEQDLGGRGYSVDRPRGGFRGRSRGSFPRGDSRPYFGDHEVEGGRNAPPFDNDPNFDRQRSSSQERFRRFASRHREEGRGGQFQDNPRDSHPQEARRSPNPERYDNQGGPAINRGRGRGRYNQGYRGRSGPYRGQPRHQDVPPFRDDYKDPVEEEPSWEDEERPPRWRPRSQETNPPRDEPDPKRRWDEPRNDNVTVITEETLTIKVDMSRPVYKNSPLCYSSDRQLSLDLVNVGRQRLDFLPLLEHSGTYQESASHTGTFAQEIITLVHFVKDQYFRGNGVTLNQRFSAPQTGSHPEDELTLSQRFSANRGFSSNLDSLLDQEDDEPPFFRLGSLQEARKQPPRGPGDLRHDLERRRQEKLEAVKVTIGGGGGGGFSPGEPDLTPPMEQEGFSGWEEEPTRRREGSAGPRRGTYNRPGPGPERRNNPVGHQRQNFHSGAAGPNWR